MAAKEDIFIGNAQEIRANRAEMVRIKLGSQLPIPIKSRAKCRI